MTDVDTGSGDLARAVPRTRAELLADLPAEWPRSEVSLPDARLAVRRAEPADPATAEPALFVHGLGGNSTNWTDLMAMLRDRVDGLAVDLPGFGWSPPPRDGDWTPRGTAATLATLVEQQWPGRPVHLFGNSLGGAVAVQLAARHPELVRTLTLVSPALPRIVPRRTSIHLPVIALPGVGSRLVQKYLTLDASRRARASVDSCFADPAAIPPLRLAEAEAEVRRRDGLPYLQDAFTQSLRGLLATYLDTSGQRPWRLAERIAVPTLLVYGRQDKLVDPIAAHSNAFPDRRVLLVMHCGHVAQLEAPDLVNDAWRRMLPHPEAGPDRRH
ncbi:MAG TPA: alpha/beta fold hydrolase [Candidatus Nanopelagicales bacterium]|nr:alpha/beta fold hydrolase [Candidatus Nanopelagicales bacterium]